MENQNPKKIPVILVFIIASLVAARLLIGLTNTHIFLSRDDLFRSSVSKEFVSGVSLPQCQSHYFHPNAWGHLFLEIAQAPLYQLLGFSYLATIIKVQIWFLLTALAWYLFIRKSAGELQGRYFLLLFFLMPSFGLDSSFRSGHFENLLPIAIAANIVLSAAKKQYSLSNAALLFWGAVCGLLSCYHEDVLFALPVFFLFFLILAKDNRRAKYLFLSGYAATLIFLFTVIIFNTCTFSVCADRIHSLYVHADPQPYRTWLSKAGALLGKYMYILFTYSNLPAKRLIAFFLYFSTVAPFLFLFWQSFLKRDTGITCDKCRILSADRKEGAIFFAIYSIYFFIFSLFFCLYTLGKIDEFINYRHLVYLLIPFLFYVSYLFSCFHYLLANAAKGLRLTLAMAMALITVTLSVYAYLPKINLTNLTVLYKMRGYNYYFLVRLADTQDQIKKLKNDPVWHNMPAADKLDYYLGIFFPGRPDIPFYLNSGFIKAAGRDNLNAFICGAHIGWYSQGLRIALKRRNENESIDYFYRQLYPRQKFMEDIFSLLHTNEYFMRGFGWGTALAHFEFLDNFTLTQMTEKGYLGKTLRDIIPANDVAPESMFSSWSEGISLFLYHIGIPLPGQMKNRVIAVENELTGHI